MSIVPFDFNGFELRTLGTWDAPLFVAADVCKILEIKNVSMACNRLKDIQKCISSTDTLGGNQDLLCVTATGLYALIMGSRKKVAVDFQEWVYEVIESIRKTGSYQIKPMSAGEMMVMQAQQFLALEQRQSALELENQRLQLEQQQIKAEQAQLQEAVLEHDAEIGRIFEPDGMLITLAGCLNLHGLHATAAQLSSVGRAASKMYRDRYDKEPEKIGDARYGMVNAYPRAIAEQVLIDHGYLTEI